MAGDQLVLRRGRDAGDDRLLARTRARGELLSFLLFDEEFIAGCCASAPATPAAGCAATRGSGAATPPTTCRLPADSDAVNEQEAIAEFRARRMH